MRVTQHYGYDALTHDRKWDPSLIELLSDGSTEVKRVPAQARRLPGAGLGIDTGNNDIRGSAIWLVGPTVPAVNELAAEPQVARVPRPSVVIVIIQSFPRTPTLDVHSDHCRPEVACETAGEDFPST